MGKYSPHLKHFILTLYSPKQRGHGFKSLAARFDIKGGGATVKRWYDRWNGTLASFHHRRGAGRPTILSRPQIKQHILAPIRKKNRKFISNNYIDIRNSIEQKTGTSISLRSIQRYGKHKEAIKKKRTKKKTTLECKLIKIYKHKNKIHFLFKLIH